MSYDFQYSYDFTADQAFVQLDFYLKALNLPFGIKDLYQKAYQERLGPHYSDDWIDDLADDPEVQKGLEQPFTTTTIIETLMNNGHEPIIRALLRETRQTGIGFTQAYIVGINKRK